MSWHQIEGHDAQVEQFRRRIERDRLAGTYLFVGTAGIGKRMFAMQLAQALFCDRNSDVALKACGQCAACQQVAAGTHPDLLLVEKPPEKNVLPIELFIGRRERRMREGLCHDLGLKPFSAARRIAVIDDAQLLNEESANCLLKTLEEPPPGAMIVLISIDEDQVLSTIRSRCQTIRFRPLDVEHVAEILLREGSISDVAEAHRIAAESAGSMRQAQTIASPEYRQFQQNFCARLAESTCDNQALVEMVAGFIDSGGRDAPARRDRARQVVGMAVEFFRQVLRSGSGLEPAEGYDQDFPTALVDAETLVRCAERCIETLEQIDSFVHQSAWLECWLDDLTRIRARGRSVST